MNYLAHLHIAHRAGSNLLGNLLGDFVRGNPDEAYGQAIANGIRLHRRVDMFTDTHATSKQLKQLFPESLKRYAPIALDMFWDHCLARQWSDFHAESLDDFVRQCSDKIKHQQQDTALPDGYLRLVDKLWAQQWLQSYREFDNTCYALERIAQRRPKLAPLAECNHCLAEHYPLLTAHFSAFYQLVMEDALTFNRSLEKN